MAIFKCSEVEILTNYPTLGEPHFNSYHLPDPFFKKYLGKEARFDPQPRNGDQPTWYVFVALEGDYDSTGNIALPCPPYCDDKNPPKGKIVSDGGSFRHSGTFYRMHYLNHFGQYAKNELDAILAPENADGLLEIKIKIRATGEEKNAIIGLNGNGNMLNTADNLVVIESNRQ